MRRIAAVATLVLMNACTMRDSAETDSVRVADSVRAADSITASDAAPQNAFDSAAIAPPSDASGNLTGETTKGQRPRSDSIMGRDSAFGPIGSIDERGNITPIKK